MTINCPATWPSSTSPRSTSRAWKLIIQNVAYKYAHEPLLGYRRRQQPLRERTYTHDTLLAPRLGGAPRRRARRRNTYWSTSAWLRATSIGIVAGQRQGRRVPDASSRSAGSSASQIAEYLAHARRIRRCRGRQGEATAMWSDDRPAVAQSPPFPDARDQIADEAHRHPPAGTDVIGAVPWHVDDPQRTFA